MPCLWWLSLLAVPDTSTVCTPRQRGLQGELHLDSYFLFPPVFLIKMKFLKSRSSINASKCQEKPLEKVLPFCLTSLTQQPSRFTIFALHTKQRNAFRDAVDAVRAHKYCMSSLWLSLCFLLTKHNSSIIVSLENMFWLPTRVHPLYSVYLQFVHTVWLCIGLSLCAVIIISIVLLALLLLDSLFSAC